MSEVRPEQDSNRKEKAKKKKGGLWTGRVTWLCFRFGVFFWSTVLMRPRGMLHVVALNFK